MSDSGDRPASRKAQTTAFASDSSPKPQARLLVGTCTDSTRSEGIYALDLNLPPSPISGSACAGHTVMSNANPIFLSMFGGMLVAAHEVAGKAKAAVYAAHDDGSITHISTIADKSGAKTCHVSVHPNGRWVYGSNYESGSLSCWPLRLDGQLGPLQASVQHTGHGANRCRQSTAHVRSSLFIGALDDSGNFRATDEGRPNAGDVPLLAVVDLGSDAITLYRAPAGEGLDPHPQLIVRTPPGFGPREIQARPHRPGQLAVVGELGNGVIIYDAARESWREIARFDLPSCGGIRSLATHAQFSPCGRWLYASISGKNALAVYELDEDAQVLAQARFGSGGKDPCHFSLSPCGRFLALANRESDDVVVFEAPKPEDAAMRELARWKIPSPTCVIWA